MNQEDQGKLILKAVPSGKAEEAVVAYLKRLFKNVPPEKVTALVKKAPVVLSKSLPANKAQMIAANLQKLGATTVYVPEAETHREPRPPQTTSPPQVSASERLEQPSPQPPTVTTRPRKPRRRRRIRTAAAVLFLIGAAVFVYVRFSGWLRQMEMQEGYEAAPVVSITRVDFTTPRPISQGTPSIMNVAPHDMYAAFAYQYRQRPDRRFIAAFETLTIRWGQLHGRRGDAGEYTMGRVTSNGKEVSIPLVRSGSLVTGITLPLPTTFPGLLSALDQWLTAIESKEKATSIAPVKATKRDQSYKAAIQMVDMVDPRFIAVGLSVLENLWQGGQRDGRILKAVVRAYAMLLMVLTPDLMGLTDDFASEALAFLALARRWDPKLDLSREEALLAMNMGYRSHGASIMQGLVQSTSKAKNEVLDAYMRQDIAALKRLRSRGSEVLGYYLLARLYREIGLWQEAKGAAWELLQRYPNLYPCVVENIYAGDLNVAKVLTVLYPAHILGRLESQVSQTSPKQTDSWVERLKGFSGEGPTETISLAKFEGLLKQWSPYTDETSCNFIIDEERLKVIYRSLYADAVYLRFQLLSKRWGVVEKADAYVQSLAPLDNKHPLFLLMEGMVHAELGDRGSAESMFRRLINHPGASGWLVYEAFTNMGRPLERIRLLPKAAEQLDGRPFHRLRMGALFQYRIWYYDLAAQYYASGLAQDPYQFWAYQELARVSGSHEPLLSALEKFPHSFQLLAEAGEYFANESDTASKEKAEYILGLAQQLAPSKVTLARSRARVLRDLQRYEDALRVLNEWIDRYGRGDLPTTMTKGLRANIYLKMGQPDKALASLTGDVDSYQAGVMMVRARAYEKLGKMREAAEQYQKAVARYPTVDHVLAGTAGFLWRHGDDELAAKMIAKGRPSHELYSRWYFQDFLDALEDADDDRILNALKALQRYGATNWELVALGWSLEKTGKAGVAFKILSGRKGGGMMESLENIVSAYRLLLKWKGREAASEYLDKAIPPEGRGPLMMVLYKKGLFKTILEQMEDPDSYPRRHREFMWLQMLIAWLASNREPADLAGRLTAHYEGQKPFMDKLFGKILPSTARRVLLHEDDSIGYYSIGRFLLGMISRDELLAQMRINNQRCEFTYYIGLAERLKGNFAEAAKWYHLCRETLLTDNGEFHWASDELFWWAHMGLKKRHRLVNDDIEAYDSRKAQAQRT